MSSSSTPSSGTSSSSESSSGTSSSSGSISRSGSGSISRSGSGSSSGSGSFSRSKSHSSVPGNVPPPAALALAKGWWDFTEYSSGTVPDSSPNSNPLTESGGPASYNARGLEISSNSNYFTMTKADNYKGVWMVAYLDHTSAAGSNPTQDRHIGMIGSYFNGSQSYVFYPRDADISYPISIDGSTGDSGYVTLNYGTELGPGGNLGTEAMQDDILDSWTCAKVRYSSGPRRDLVRVGGFHLSGTTYDFRGILAEVIVFDTFPSSAIETSIDNYLKVKYSDVIPIP